MKWIVFYQVIAIASAFQLRRLVGSNTRWHQQKSGKDVWVLTDVEDKHLSFNPMEGYQGVDVKRAKDCAEHFGKCSVEEMESLRDNLHKQRLQRLLFSHSSTSGSSAFTPKDSLEKTLLEEELELQLALLKEHEPDQTLFPLVEDGMQELPHLKDCSNEKARKVDFSNLVHKAEVELASEEAMLGDINLEAIALCGAFAVLLLSPMVFQ